MKSKRDLIEQLLIKKTDGNKVWDAWVNIRSVIEEVTGNLYMFESIPFNGITGSTKEEDKTITLFVDINGKQTEDSVYQVVQEEDKFNFISNDDDTKNQYGDLTLTPLEDETEETGQSQ